MMRITVKIFWYTVIRENSGKFNGFLMPDRTKGEGHYFTYRLSDSWGYRCNGCRLRGLPEPDRLRLQFPSGELFPNYSLVPHLEEKDRCSGSTQFTVGEVEAVRWKGQAIIGDGRFRELPQQQAGSSSGGVVKKPSKKQQQKGRKRKRQ